MSVSDAPLPSDAALDALFAQDGVLSRSLPGFRLRPQQLEMARAVARAIQERGRLVAEAGTGTGKTFAYLVPALLYGGKVIVSTGTKTLQDQLYERDIPMLRDALRVPVTISVLKGRANYVCHHHLERASREDRLPSRDDARHLRKIIAFAQASERGDRALLADVPENASIWPLVTSTRDNCLGSNCPFHQQCFVMKARKDALDADVVVVNHHLFFADVMLRDEGLAELLPACNTVILDEAHQLPDTATLFFGEQTTAGQLAELARDAEEAAARLARWRPPLANERSDVEGEWIRWIDVTPLGWQLHASPLSIADIFRRQVESTGRAWIFTSATLAVARDFTHYTNELGLARAATGCWDSPFDYAAQGLLYVPRDLPAPNTREHTDAVVDAAVPVLKASGGRAFMLFTTLRALAAARERLVASLVSNGLDYPLLVQGDGSKTELLTRFRTLRNAVLLGSASFWEGVDVPGEALSLVVIDKLPFAPPDDPLLAARLEKLKSDGGNPFLDWQLPQAAISLKQGAGRLIRTETDRGVLMK